MPTSKLPPLPRNVALDKVRRAVKHAVRRFARARVNHSWAGTAPADERTKIHALAHAAPVRLQTALDSFERAIRADERQRTLDAALLTVGQAQRWKVGVSPDENGVPTAMLLSDDAGSWISRREAMRALGRLPPAD